MSRRLELHASTAAMQTPTTPPLSPPLQQAQFSPATPAQRGTARHSVAPRRRLRRKAPAQAVRQARCKYTRQGMARQDRTRQRREWARQTGSSFCVSGSSLCALDTLHPHRMGPPQHMLQHVHMEAGAAVLCCVLRVTVHAGKLTFQCKAVPQHRPRQAAAAWLHFGLRVWPPR